ncbi:MAG: hypothetical protein NC332_05630 [Firmicutes bacterium]|nr:hypothetical protein [Bacillota bacterium]
MPQQLQGTFGPGVFASRQDYAVETVLAVQSSGVGAALNGKNCPKAGLNGYSMVKFNINFQKVQFILSDNVVF